MNSSYECKIFDYRIMDINPDDDDRSSSESMMLKESLNTKCVIQMFGIDTNRNTYSIFVKEYKPYFYLRVDDTWGVKKMNAFMKEIKGKIRPYFADSIYKFTLVSKKILYGFDNHREYKCIQIYFDNMACYNKVKNLFFMTIKGTKTKEKERQKNQNKKMEEKKNVATEDQEEEDYRYCITYPFEETNVKIYESNVPPLLRFFHIYGIQPCGWVRIERFEDIPNRTTSCTHEISAICSDISPLPDKEDTVPFKICSFDIEALSSHGDFPLAKKDYKKLANEIVDFMLSYDDISFKTVEDITNVNDLIRIMILAAFKYGDCPYVEYVELLCSIPSRENINELIDRILNMPFTPSGKDKIPVQLKNCMNKVIKRDECVDNINAILTECLPPVRGDIVTFIGSTFKIVGQPKPYLNHCIVLDECDDSIFNEDTVIVTKDSESEVLREWTKIIQKEDPDIIIGYNIFGFDYPFMLERANQLRCADDFLKLSRNTNEICGKKDPENKKRYKIVEKSITIASGTHEMSYIEIPGRVQIDLYNYFRRDYNLESYKLDYVSGHFIRNKVVKIDGYWLDTNSSNGLNVGSFIHIEEISHSSDYYDGGAKFRVEEIDGDNGRIRLNQKINPDLNKTVMWCLAKDDVTPQDIFRMTKEGPKERGIIAKYCIQDCNLVQYLLAKIDVITGFVEMSNLCSVPLSFIVFRGQGIKLFSFMAKQCAAVDTIIPVLNKENDGGYEGAIVLDPKCGMYLDEPVACVDYSSLYPSSMISENISHDSKVWTKSFDLNGESICIQGERDENGTFMYDNLQGYQYIDIQYDSYIYKRETKSAAPKKIKNGYKISRFVQFPDGKKAILPTILQTLLKARKQTRTKAKFKTIKTSKKDYIGSIIEKTDDDITMKTEQGEVVVLEKRSVQSITDTYDSFMKNVLDKRQLAIKVTANSLYGQCGAKTSSFYEQDVAASTTSTGRKLLTYAKRVVEDVYGDSVCTTKYGTVHSHAEYVYGDSVTGDTPLILRRLKLGEDNELIREIFITTIANLSDQDKWKPYENFKPDDTVESNRRNKQQNQHGLNQIEIWTKSGWKYIKRVIRHRCNKKIYRVLTNHGMIDVTEDHSLIDVDGNYIKPSDLTKQTNLYINIPHEQGSENTTTITEIVNFVYDNVQRGDKRRVENIEYNGQPIMCKSIQKQLFEPNIVELCTKEQSRLYLTGLHCAIQHTNLLDDKSRYIEYIHLSEENALDMMCHLIYVYGEHFKIIHLNTMYKIITTDSTCIQTILYDAQKHRNGIHSDILNDSHLNMQYFLSGFHFGSNMVQRYDRDLPTLVTRNKMMLSGLVYLLCQVGCVYNIDYVGDKIIVIMQLDETRISPCKIDSTYLLYDNQSDDDDNNNLTLSVVELNDKATQTNEEYNDFVYDIETHDGTFNCGFPIIVKNTDSVFMSFKLTDMDGNKIVGKEALKHTIELAKEVGSTASKFLKAPHDLEYEKTFMPFCLLSKKRYVGMLYENDPEKCYRKSMGIVLNRRDNAPIVKDVYGGIIDILMKEMDVKRAIEFTRSCLSNLADGKCPIEKLVITKSLRSYYKNPNQIAHKVLADRMGQREPGNKPKAGDRIPFVYIEVPPKDKFSKKSILQGDKIENPAFIVQNSIRPDHGFYITNQIMKPILQLFALVLENIPEFKSHHRQTYRTSMKLIYDCNLSDDKINDKIQTLRESYVRRFIFERYIIKCMQARERQTTIGRFFK